MTTYTKEDIQTAIERVKKPIPPSLKEQIKETLWEMQERHLSPKEAFGFSDEMIDAIYEYGYSAFQAGKYEESIKVFSFLRELDLFSYRAAFGIAASYQHLRKFDIAAASYLICTYIDPLNPIPTFHLAYCFEQLGQYLSALEYVEVTIQLCEKILVFPKIREKALLEKEYLINTLKEEAQKEAHQ